MQTNYQIIKTIARKELLCVTREKIFTVTWIVFVILLLVAGLTGLDHYKREKAARENAKQLFREQWLHQDPRHPHIAAHFGNFAVMPLTALSLFDRGLDAYSGKVVYLEPHKQNDFSFKPSEEQGSSLRFGELTIALMLQLLFPLFILFSCFDSFTKERQSGNLKMLYSQGISFTAVYLGKFAGRFLTVLLLVLPCIILLAVTLELLQQAAMLFWHTAILIVFYLLYLALITAVTILVSALSYTGRGAILSLISIWIIMSVLLPKWTANAGNNLYPLPTKYEFNTAIRLDMEKGINGHEPRSARTDTIKKQLLARYHVDTISKLPFNYEGYIMQVGEEYSSRVYDKHFSLLQRTLNRQNQLSLWTSVIDPYIAIHNLSMALCGSDFYTHLDFQLQAERYRRTFVQQMNGDMKNHSTLGDWNYKAGREVYASVKPFQYSPPAIRQSLRHYAAGFFSFFIWSAVTIICVYICNRKTLK